MNLKERLKGLDQRELHLIGVCVVAIVCTLYYHPSDIKGFMADETFDIAALGGLMGTVVAPVLYAVTVYFYSDADRSLKMLCLASVAYAAFNSLLIDLTNSMLFFQIVLMDVVVVLEIACFVFLWKGFMHNITRLIILHSVLTASYLIPWAIEKYALGDLVGARQLLYYTVPLLIHNLVFISYLARPDIRDVEPSEELKIRLARVEASYTMSSACYISLRNLVNILEYTDTGWTFFEEGPVEKQYTGYITDETHRKWALVCRKWKDEDFVRAVLSPEEYSHGAWGLKFEIMHHHFTLVNDKGFVRIYGNDGFFIELYTENPRIYKDNAVSHALDKLIREF